MRTTLLLLLALVSWGSACHSSGCCGGGGCCSCCRRPPPVVQCVQASCQPGYQCGAYGCARRKAFAANTKRIEGLILSGDTANSAGINSGNANSIMTSHRRPKISTIPPEFVNVTIDRLTNPNFIFHSCCEQRGLPDACLQKCHFNTFDSDTLTSMFFKHDDCPIEAAAEIQFCAAQGLDHSGCCRLRGVTNTEAGDKCLAFCDQRPGKFTKLDYSYLPCFERFEEMKQCFFDEIKLRAVQKFVYRKQLA